MDKIFEFLISGLNCRNSLKKRSGWLIDILIYLRAITLWKTKREFKVFKDNLFYVRKQSRHPKVGERSIEYPWVCMKLRNVRNKTILDVGCKEGLPITDLLRKDNFVYGIDPNIEKQISGQNYLIIPGDIRNSDFSDNSLDIVVIVSTLEHVGVSGRYNISTIDDNGDFKATREILRILKPGGILCGTVPFGIGKSLPLNRLYNRKSLHRLLTGYDLVDLTYYKYYENYSLWLEVDDEIAEINNWDKEPWYSLACFYTRKPIE